MKFCLLQQISRVGVPSCSDIFLLERRHGSRSTGGSEDAQDYIHIRRTNWMDLIAGMRGS